MSKEQNIQFQCSNLGRIENLSIQRDKSNCWVQCSFHGYIQPDIELNLQGKNLDADYG